MLIFRQAKLTQVKKSCHKKQNDELNIVADRFRIMAKILMFTLLIQITIQAYLEGMLEPFKEEELINI